MAGRCLSLRSSGGRMSDKSSVARLITTLIVTLAIIVLVSWVLYETVGRVDSVAQVDDNGVVIKDEWARMNTLIAITMPLLTAVVGFWFGSRGESAARADAGAAREEVKEATQSAKNAEDEAKEVRQEATTLAAAVPPGALTSLQEKMPQIFGSEGDGGDGGDGGDS